MEHIELAKKADLAIIAPATANVCAKLAHGLADDMLTTTLLACQCPRIIAPAMNTRMYENPITQDLSLIHIYRSEADRLECHRQRYVDGCDRRAIRQKIRVFQVVDVYKRQEPNLGVFAPMM